MKRKKKTPIQQLKIFQVAVPVATILLPKHDSTEDEEAAVPESQQEREEQWKRSKPEAGN